MIYLPSESDKILFFMLIRAAVSTGNFPLLAKNGVSFWLK